jgi:flagellar protein FliS
LLFVALRGAERKKSEASMSFVAVQKAYTEATLREAENLTHPHELIQVTLQTLRQSLDLLSQDVIDAEFFAKSKAKALTAIYILQTSLDIDKGGEIARNLFQVYEYCRLQVVNSKRRDVPQGLALCIKLLDELIDAWKRIK